MLQSFLIVLSGKLKISHWCWKSYLSLIFQWLRFVWILTKRMKFLLPISFVTFHVFIRMAFTCHSKFAATKYSLIFCSQTSTEIIAGYGKGIANARLPFKILWKHRICVLYHFLQKICDTEKINTKNTSLCNKNLQVQIKNQIIAVSLLLIVSQIYSERF